MHNLLTRINVTYLNVLLFGDANSLLYHNLSTMWFNFIFVYAYSNYIIKQPLLFSYILLLRLDRPGRVKMLRALKLCRRKRKLEKFADWKNEIIYTRVIWRNIKRTFFHARRSLYALNNDVLLRHYSAASRRWDSDVVVITSGVHRSETTTVD